MLAQNTPGLSGLLKWSYQRGDVTRNKMKIYKRDNRGMTNKALKRDIVYILCNSEALTLRKLYLQFLIKRNL